jgi:hypothetical protein
MRSAKEISLSPCSGAYDFCQQSKAPGAIWISPLANDHPFLYLATLMGTLWGICKNLPPPLVMTQHRVLALTRYQNPPALFNLQLEVTHQGNLFDIIQSVISYIRDKNPQEWRYWRCSSVKSRTEGSNQVLHLRSPLV